MDSGSLFALLKMASSQREDSQLREFCTEASTFQGFLSPEFCRWGRQTRTRILRSLVKFQPFLTVVPSTHVLPTSVARGKPGMPHSLL